VTGRAGKDALDIAIGARVRERRRAIRMSQSALAKQLGVTFQQVQKYERGTNRISGSTLVRIAAALRVGVANLVDEEPDPLPADARELLDVFTKIRGKHGRAAVIAMAKILAGLE
jgi:transcriptional regulator with XRE-family HTH domain